MPKSSAPAAAAPPGFDLAQIHVVEASFLDCVVTTDIPVSGFVPPVVMEVLDLLAIPSFDMAAGQVYYTLSLRVATTGAAGAATGITGFFRIHFAFAVDNLSDYAEVDAGFDGSHPSADLMIMLGGVAYATSRGLLIGKTAGTPLNGFSLPLMSPQQLFYDSITQLNDGTDEQQAEEPKKRKAAVKRPAAKSKK